MITKHIHQKMIEVISTKEDWNSLVNTFDRFDFYHTFDYHMISKGEDEKPILLYYKVGDIEIIFPLLLRKIEGTSYKDATSVYGYAGPLSKNLGNNFDNSHYIKALTNFFIEKKIVSVFSRLNPFLENQNIVLKGIGELHCPGKVVYIDLSLSLENQKSQYNQRYRTYINKSRKLCKIKKAHSKKDIDCFIEMYYENMSRVDATSRYFFDSNYFYELMKSINFKSEIYLVEYENNIISGAMFIKINDIVQYHLSGTKKDYLFLNPIKLLIDEIRILSTQENFRFLNLGGGVGNIEDSLFEFKAGFSREFKNFNLWRYIVDQDMYNELSNQNETFRKIDTTKKRIDFFPLYRYS